MSWWVTDYLETFGRAFLLSYIVWVIGSIVLHELAHGWMAIRSGDDTPIATGHMTWNPHVHMGTFGLVMFALIGFAFGAMPTNPRRFRHRNDDAKVALAGPLTNLILAVTCVVLLVVWRRIAQNEAISDNLAINMYRFFVLGAQINFTLGILNLIPVMPLDGATVLARFSRVYRDLFTGEQARQMTMMLLIVILLFVSSHIFALASRLTKSLSDGLYGLLF